MKEEIHTVCRVKRNICYFNLELARLGNRNGNVKYPRSAEEAGHDGLHLGCWRYLCDNFVGRWGKIDISIGMAEFMRETVVEMMSVGSFIAGRLCRAAALRWVR